MKNSTLTPSINQRKHKGIKRSNKAVAMGPLFLFLMPSISAQTTGPCDAANGWDGGATWNMDGSTNGAPNSPSPSLLNITASVRVSIY